MLPKRIDRNSHKADEKRRSPAHRAWVRGFNCCVPGCEERPIECAHVRLGTDGGTGIKPSDRWCISLCRFHHNRQHDVGELSFEAEFGIDMKKLADEFSRKSPHRSKLGL